MGYPDFLKVAVQFGMLGGYFRHILGKTVSFSFRQGTSFQPCQPSPEKNFFPKWKKKVSKIEDIWYNIDDLPKNHKRGRRGFTMPTLMSSVLPIVVREGLKEENIEAVVGLVLKGGKKISSKVAEYLEKRKQQGGTGEEIPDEVQKEVQETVRELMEEQARPVYMGGVAFLFEKEMDNEKKEALGQILTNSNEDAEGLTYEKEEDEEYQGKVDQFMGDNYGRSLYENENDYCIGDGSMYLNFAFDEEEDSYRLYDEDAVRGLADALNRLLGDRYITGFFTY